MNPRREGCGRPRLVVIFQKTGQLVLKIAPRLKVFTHQTGMTIAEAVVEPLVVGVIEPLLLHRPFQVPVDLSQEAEVRKLLAHALDRLRPKGFRPDAPGPFKDVREQQHGHIAAHAVTSLCDFHQFPDHRFLRSRVAVVELKGVRPAREIWIASVGENHIAAPALDSRIVLGKLGQVLLAAGYVIVGMILHPGMIQSGMIGNEVEHQAQAALAEFLAQAGQSGISSQIDVCGVAGDGEPGTRDVLFTQVGSVS